MFRYLWMPGHGSEPKESVEAISKHLFFPSHLDKIEGGNYCSGHGMLSCRTFIQTRSLKCSRPMMNKFDQTPCPASLTTQTVLDFDQTWCPSFTTTDTVLDPMSCPQYPFCYRLWPDLMFYLQYSSESCTGSGTHTILLKLAGFNVLEFSGRIRRRIINYIQTGSKWLRAVL